MPTASPPHAKTLVVLGDGATDMPIAALTGPAAEDVVVAGSSRVQLALAPLSLPGAEVIWTDFRCSASIRSLRQKIEARGGIDRLVLAGGRRADAAGLGHLSAMLTLLPLLRTGGGGEVLICLNDSACARSVRAFLDRLGPELGQGRVRVRWADAVPS